MTAPLENAAPAPKVKWVSAGCVIVPALSDGLRDLVYLIRPTNNYGGLGWTLPKGRVDAGETIRAAALREVFEETGLRVRLVENSYLGAYEGGFSITHYCVATVERMESAPGWETAELRSGPRANAIDYMVRTGNTRDAAVLRAADEWLKLARPLP